MLSARPDLVILDVKLPDISGFEVCRRIKSDPATSVIPVLHISTTFVHLEDKIQGLDSGADGYLTNVAEPMELIATVRALLRAAGPRKPRSSRRGSGKPRSMRSATGSCCSMPRGESCRRTGLLNIFSGAHGARSLAGSFLPCGVSNPSLTIHRLRGCSSPVRARQRTSRSVTCGSTSASILCETQEARSTELFASSRISLTGSEWRCSFFGRLRNCRRSASEKTNSWRCWRTSYGTPWHLWRIRFKSFECSSREMSSSTIPLISRAVRSST